MSDEEEERVAEWKRRYVEAMDRGNTIGAKAMLNEGKLRAAEGRIAELEEKIHALCEQVADLKKEASDWENSYHTSLDQLNEAGSNREITMPDVPNYNERHPAVTAGLVEWVSDGGMDPREGSWVLSQEGERLALPLMRAKYEEGLGAGTRSLMSIPVRCFTNLTKYKSKEWPDYLPAVPRVNEFVGAADGSQLRIVSLIWTAHALEIELDICATWLPSSTCDHE